MHMCRGLAWASCWVLVAGCKLDFTSRRHALDGGAEREGSADAGRPASPLDASTRDDDAGESGSPEPTDAEGVDGSTVPDLDAGVCSAAQSERCTTDFPCRTGNGVFTCRGRFVDWPVTPRASNSAGFVVDAAANTVLDQASGLLWVRRTGDITRDYVGAEAYCDALGEHYHVPSIAEYSSLLTTATIPDVDPGTFPDGAGLPYWTSTPANPLVRDQGGRFMYELGEREGALSVAPRSRVEQLRVACVRVAEPRFTVGPDQRLEVHADYVRDRNTGLSWIRNAPEQDLSYVDAEALCTASTVAGRAWRMPTLAELLSLGDPLLPYLGAPTDIFGGWPRDAYWTRDVPYGQPGHHYTLNYGVLDGQFDVHVFDDGTGNPVRCVSRP